MENGFIPSTGSGAFRAATPLKEVDRIFLAQQAAFRQAPWPGAKERVAHLYRLREGLKAYRKTIIEAIDTDFEGRSADETLLAELFPSMEGLAYAARHVAGWMKPSRRTPGLMFRPARARVECQPKGVAGIIVPWNYPLFLAVSPLTAALAAGNRVMVKMSEYAPRLADVFQKMIGERFEENHVAVVWGGADVGMAFTARPFDHLLFTGSTDVGRHVMRAAAGHLTPVTLELGGKSPAIVSRDIPVERAAERIMFGKAFNAGQTCIAPDYVLCPADRMAPFLDACKTVFARCYPTVKENPDYTAIINDRQHARLQEMLRDAEMRGATVIPVNPAGEDFTGSRKMPLYLVHDCTEKMRLLQEEIFGPVLPVIPYETLQQAVDYVNDRPRPLALYYFGYNRKNADFVTRNTISGGVSINETLVHAAADDLPFGGIGASGMGEYHGQEGFLTFSKAKSVFEKPWFNLNRLILPPYDRPGFRLIRRLLTR
ncbi:MAG: coniferyl aldehyde dehydrogenase [Thermodesulfobacteriota bacterium]|nr:coniferyl aldehyde dehydrogenase [Thermodesulfobacteriota bacterium]